MKPRAFQELLDRYGGNLPDWPEKERRAAECLLETSAEARAMRRRTCRFEALMGACEVPAAPDLEAIVEYATRQPQRTAPVASRSPLAGYWFGFGRWHFGAFALCLLIGLGIGFLSGQGLDAVSSLYDAIDSFHGGDDNG